MKLRTLIKFAVKRKRGKLVEQGCLYAWGNKDNRKWMEANLIFNTEGAAKKWIKHWKNGDDFEIIKVVVSPLNGIFYNEDMTSVTPSKL